MGKWTLDVQGGTGKRSSPIARLTEAARSAFASTPKRHAASVRAAPGWPCHPSLRRAYFYLVSASQTSSQPGAHGYFSAGYGLSKKHYEWCYDKGWQMSYWFPGGENIAGGRNGSGHRWAVSNGSSMMLRWNDPHLHRRNEKRRVTNAGGAEVYCFPDADFGMKLLPEGRDRPLISISMILRST